MKKKYKLQNTNYKQITNYNVPNYKGNGVVEVDQALNQLTINTKGSHGWHQDSFKLKTLATLIKSFCGSFTGPGCPAARGAYLAALNLE